MHYIYRISINNPQIDSGVTNFPPQILASDWANNLLISMENVGPGKFAGQAGKPISQFAKYFFSLEALNTWLTAHQLTDPTLISVLQEWQTTYGITYTEVAQEVPVITPESGALLGSAWSV